MESKLITPTLHVEVQISKHSQFTTEQHVRLRGEVRELLTSTLVSVQIGPLTGFVDGPKLAKQVNSVEIADYTGPRSATGWYDLARADLDVQTYSLRAGSDSGARRTVKESGEEAQSARILALPNVALQREWSSLVFDDGLPSRILRYLVRMMGMMSQPGVDLTTFNWNRLCLLHGPPGSGKSTLCRALAQKLSIRLGGVFLSGQLVEVNANAMLSKYFGESGKLIESTFAKVRGMAEDDNKKLIVVVIDEVETIAGSRQRASDSGECNDGLRVSLPSMFVAHTTSPYQRTSTAARARGTADVSTQSIYRVLCGTWTRAIFLWRHNQQHREQCVHGEYCTDLSLIHI